MVPITVVQLVTLSVDLIIQSLQMKTAREAQEKDHRVGETIWQPSSLLLIIYLWFV